MTRPWPCPSSMPNLSHGDCRAGSCESMGVAIKGVQMACEVWSDYVMNPTASLNSLQVGFKYKQSKTTALSQWKGSSASSGVQPDVSHKPPLCDIINWTMRNRISANVQIC